MDPCLAFLMDRIVGVLVDEVTGDQMEVSIPHLAPLPCHCSAVPRGLYSGEGPVYYNKKSHRWVEQITPLRKAGLMPIYQLAKEWLCSQRKMVNVPLVLSGCD